MEPTSSPDRQMHLRVPAGLYAELKAYAARTHRSANSAAVHLIALGLEREAVFAPSTEAQVVDGVHLR